MVETVPSVINWSVTPQNGQVGYFTLMNTWLFESTSVIASLNLAINKINEAGQDINNIGTNAINAITLDTIDDLATYTGTGLVIVKDINRGGNFVSKTAIEIDPFTGSLYAVNGGTVFAKVGGGFWARQYNTSPNVKWWGAKGDGSTDDTVAISNSFTYCDLVMAIAFMPKGRYKISDGLITPRAGIDMEAVGYGSGEEGDSCLYLTGSGYTALTVTTAKTFNVCIAGNGTNNNGILFQNPILSNFHKVRVYNLRGFGVKVNKCWDSIFNDISVELCGTTSEYAFSINNDGDTSNMSHFLRLQVEQSKSKAIYISPNTLSCVIDNIHSERATNAVDNFVYLGGNRCQYNSVRITATSIASGNTGKITLSGASSTFIGLLTEGSLPVFAEAYNDSIISLVTPEIQGNFALVADQTGIIDVTSGKINTINGFVSGLKCKSSKITSVNQADYAVNKPIYDDCIIGSFSYGTVNSSVLITNSTITTLNTNYADTIVDNCTINNIVIPYTNNTTTSIKINNSKLKSSITLSSTLSGATFNGCIIDCTVPGDKGSLVFENCILNNSVNRSYSYGRFSGCTLSSNLVCDTGICILSNTHVQGDITTPSVGVVLNTGGNSCSGTVSSAFNIPTSYATKGRIHYRWNQVAGSPYLYVGNGTSWIASANL